jgi:hypothetical protein
MVDVEEIGYALEGIIADSQGKDEVQIGQGVITLLKDQIHIGYEKIRILEEG